MKKLLILFFLVMFCSGLQAEDMAKESIQEKLDYIYSIRLHDINEAKEELEKLVPASINFDIHQKSQYLNLRAHSELIRGNIDQSLHYISQVKLISNDMDLLARAKILEATALHSKGDFQRSFLIIYELLDNIERIGSQELKFSILLNAISRHSEAEIYDKSRELARKVLAQAKVNNDQYNNCIGYIELVYIALKIKNLSQSKYELEGATAVCSEIKDNLLMLTLEVIKAQVAKLEADLESAKSIYEVSLERLNTFGWKAMLVDSQIELSSIYFDLKEFDKVEKLALLGYTYSKEINDTVTIKNASEVLAKYYLHIKNMEKAKFFRKEYLEAANNHAILLRKERISYYQAMNYRAKQKESESKELALRGAN